MSNEEKIHQLTMLYLKINDSCKNCSPEKLCISYKDAYQKILETFKNDNSTWFV